MHIHDTSVLLVRCNAYDAVPVHGLSPFESCAVPLVDAWSFAACLFKSKSLNLSLTEATLQGVNTAHISLCVNKVFVQAQ